MTCTIFQPVLTATQLLIQVGENMNTLKNVQPIHACYPHSLHSRFLPARLCPLQQKPSLNNPKAHLKETLSESEFARYERSEACSANIYEDPPLFVSAVIAGNMAGLKKEGSNGSNSIWV